MNQSPQSTATLSQQVKDRDAASYDPLASSFDQLSQRVTAPVAERMVQACGARPGDQVLDVGTGTGMVAHNIAPLLGADGLVVGIDYSSGMLAAARQNHARLDKLELMRMDAERLAFPDARFDIVTSLYVLRHLPNPRTALREMLRVLKPGGRLVIGIGSGVPRNSLAIFPAALRQLGSRIQQYRMRQASACELIDGLVRELLPEQGATVTGVHSTDHSFSNQQLFQWLRADGLTAIERHWSGHRFRFDSAQDFWLLQSTLSSFARKRLQTASEDQRSELRRRFMSHCQRVLNNGGSLVYQPGALLIQANKPAA